MANRLAMLRDFARSYVSPSFDYDYWHFPHMCSPRIAQGDYFIDFTPKSDYRGPVDADGIPMLDLTSQHWARTQSVVYAPIVIEQFALGWYSRYLRDGDAAARATFLKVARWMRDSSERTELHGGAAALFPADYGRGPTLSGMAQGLAISVFCRAHKETDDRTYLERAVEAFRPFLFTIEEGGVVDAYDGVPVLQEWVNERRHVLNGHLFAFGAIVDLLATDALDETARAEVQAAYERFLPASLALGRACDMGFWTRYTLMRSVVPNVASMFYHGLHIEMAKGLFTLTGVEQFRQFAARWDAQRARLVFRAIAFLLKLASRVELEIRDRRLASA